VTTETPPRLVVQTSPFLRQGVTTPALMGDVLLALLPVVAAAVWVFGLAALLVLAAATAGAVATEWLVARASGRGSLGDRTALLTGVILGLTLPPGFPLWMAFLGGVAGIGLGKLIWGGLGDNLFNPALVGRAFLQASFPIAVTTWTPPGGLWSLSPRLFALPLMQAPQPAAAPDAVTTATPLNLMKFAHQATPVGDLFTGHIAGSLGETSALVILLAGVYLWARRAFDWRIPVSILLSVAALSGVLWAISPERYPSPLFMLLSGGLMFGAVFMATDPVTSPLAPRGAWLFGFGIGALVVLIRIWGGLPEGVMYAILLMNAATPLIERVTQPRVFGHGKRAGV
jgi:electron transport complex protein RnfD